MSGEKSIEQSFGIFCAQQVVEASNIVKEGEKAFLESALNQDSEKWKTLKVTPRFHTRDDGLTANYSCELLELLHTRIQANY